MTGENSLERGCRRRTVSRRDLLMPLVQVLLAGIRGSGSFWGSRRGGLSSGGRIPRGGCLRELHTTQPPRLGTHVNALDQVGQIIAHRGQGFLESGEASINRTDKHI